MGSSQLPGLKRPAFKAQTVDDLRELITQAELIVANLRGAGSRAEVLLFLMDTIQELLATLQAQGVDLRAERTRVETIERQLMSKDAVLLYEMRKLGGLAEVREEVKPALAQWWWYLDARVVERHRQQTRRLLWIGGGIIAVLTILFLLYRYVFPPDPRQVAVMDKTAQASNLLQAGDSAGALALYREAVAIMPEDSDLHVWVGALEEKLGHDQAAAEAYAQAEQLLGSQAEFLVQRGMGRYRVGFMEQALADADAALAIEPENAEAYFLQGSVYETQGQARQAIEAFDKAATLAGKADNSALLVMAKTRMGMLMQAAPMMPDEGALTPTPDS